MRRIGNEDKYELNNFEHNSVQMIQFIDKAPDASGVLKTITEGTTNEEVIKMLIHRINILNEGHPCMENKVALESLSFALQALEARTQDREKRGVEGTDKE